MRIIATLFLATSALASTVVGPQVTDNFKINETSFTSQGLPSPDSAIQAAAATMVWGYSSRVFHKWDGTYTTSSTCIKGQRTVYMDPNPHPSGIREEFIACAGSGWLTHLYPATGNTVSGSWAVGTQFGDRRRDVQMGVERAFLLRATNSVVASGTAYCLSNRVLNDELYTLRSYGPCQDDIELVAAGSTPGHLAQTIDVADSNMWPVVGTYPVPGTTWATLISPNVTGIGGMSYARVNRSGTAYEGLTTVVSNITPHNIYTTSYGVATTTGTGSYQYIAGPPVLSPTGYVRTSTTYDPSAARWVVTEADNSAGAGANIYQRTMGAPLNTSPWVDATSYYNYCWPSPYSPGCGTTAGMSLGTMAAIAFDPESQLLIIVGTNNQGASYPGICTSGYGIAGAGGCPGELLVVTTPQAADTVGGIAGGFTFSPMQRASGLAYPSGPSMSAFGPATVVCSKLPSPPTRSTPNCEIIVPSIDPSGTYGLHSLKFRANANDLTVSPGPTSVAIEGVWTTVATDTFFPADAKSTGPSNTGVLTLVTLRSNDQVGFSTKAAAGGSWSSFSPILNYYTGLPITSTNAPVIGLDEVLQDYRLLFTTN